MRQLLLVRISSILLLTFVATYCLTLEKFCNHDFWRWILLFSPFKLRVLNTSKNIASTSGNFLIRVIEVDVMIGQHIISVWNKQTWKWWLPHLFPHKCCCFKTEIGVNTASSIESRFLLAWTTTLYRPREEGLSVKPLVDNNHLKCTAWHRSRALSDRCVGHLCMSCVCWCVCAMDSSSCRALVAAAVRALSCSGRKEPSASMWVLSSSPPWVRGDVTLSHKL